MANPKLSTLVDPFTGSSVNTSVWNSATAGRYTLDTVNDIVNLQVGTTASTYYSFGAAGPYDATGSSLYAQITRAPVGNGGTLTIMKLDAGSNNAIQATVSGGATFQLQVQTAGTWVTTNLPTYDSHAHRWWRLREIGGQFAFDTSPDGLVWTTLATVSYSWSATAVSVYFQTGTGDVEPAGMVAAIANVNTRAGGGPNQNWPTIEDGWGAYWGANAATTPPGQFVEVSLRTNGTVNVSRGRQYELDQIRSGEAQAYLTNKDAALDPNNASGPWAGHIAPFQPYRRRAQWPPTRNLLSQVQATGGDVGGYPTGTLPASAGLLSDWSVPSIASSGSAWQGLDVISLGVAAGAPGNALIVGTTQPAAEPGTTYTNTLRVRNVATSGAPTVKPFIAWYTAGSTTPTYVDGGTVTLTGSSTAPWTTVTVTATAPANVAGMLVGLRTASETPDCSFQVDGWQLEKGATSSTWACPGVWYPVYAGFMERWPSSWDMAGTFGRVQPTVVDAFSLLSQQQLDDPLTMEINANQPRFVYRLDDPSGSLQATDWTGKNPPAQTAISKYGAGSLVFGTAVTAASSTGAYTGSTGTVATISNSNPGTNLTSGGATFLNLASAGIVGPAVANGTWTRMIAFRYTGPTPTTLAVFWSSFDKQRNGNGPGGSGLYWQIDNAGKVGLIMRGPTSGGVGVSFIPGAVVTDGNWHLVMAAYDNNHQTLVISVDGAATTWSSVDPTIAPTGLVSDTVGAYVDPTVGNGTTFNFKGDISFAGEFATALSSTAMSNIYSAWKSSCAGESTDARYARILRYAGYTGPTVLQSGLTQSMGPANTAGQDAVTALQAVVDTEAGSHFVDRSGAIQFRARSARYNATTPVYVFGERGDLGEWPYEDAQLDYDPTHLANQVTVTQESSGQVFPAQDAASITAYFPRPMTRTVNSSSVNECQDAASYFLSRYRQPATRVSSIKLHPSANPALWPVCLSLELGTRVRVMRRPPGVPATQVDCFVENVAWDFGDDNNVWVTLQCSPADLTPYGVFSAWHATINQGYGGGFSTILINAPADNTNPLAAQIAVGQQLTLSPGTVNAETLTVQSFDVTSPGWTTANVTFTTQTTHPHNAGDVICEVLPAGVTDATTWDVSARFDAVNFAY